MTSRWRKRTIKDNNGKTLLVHFNGDYEICLNINHGHQGPGMQDSHGDYWAFEITHRGDRVGEAPSLAKAKKVAIEHAKEE